MSRRGKRNILAVLLMVMAMAVAAFAVVAAGKYPGTGPRLLSEETDAYLSAEAFMNALCDGDYETASSLLENSPPLGLDRLPEEEIARTLAIAFRDSWSWSAGTLWQKDAEARLPIVFTALDLAAFTAGMDQQVLAILGRWLDEADHQTELYNPDNTWRPEAIHAAMDAAVHARLQHKEDYFAQTRLTLLLRYENQRWVVVPDDMLWALLAGEVSP